MDIGFRNQWFEIGQVAADMAPLLIPYSEFE